MVERKNKVLASSLHVDDFAIPYPTVEGAQGGVFDVPRPVCGEADNAPAGDRR